jgi:hypothetical protein
MKRITITAALSIGLLFSSACDSEPEVKADRAAPAAEAAGDKAVDAAAKPKADAAKIVEAEKKKAEVAAAPGAPKHVLVIRHKVADYGKWLPAFDADETSRVGMGTVAQQVYRDSDDESMVSVLLTGTFDAANIGKMLGNEEMQAKMAAAGVEGEPEVGLWDIVGQKKVEGEIVAHSFIRHEVADYEKWKVGFDAHEEGRTAGGVIGWGLARKVDAPNMVGVHLVIGDSEKFAAMMGGEDMKAKMKEAGVVGEPVVVSTGPVAAEKVLAAADAAKPQEAAAGADAAAPAKAEK